MIPEDLANCLKIAGKYDGYVVEKYITDIIIPQNYDYKNFILTLWFKSKIDIDNFVKDMGDKFEYIIESQNYYYYYHIDNIQIMVYLCCSKIFPYKNSDVDCLAIKFNNNDYEIHNYGNEPYGIIEDKIKRKEKVIGNYFIESILYSADKTQLNDIIDDQKNGWTIKLSNGLILPQNVNIDWFEQYHGKLTPTQIIKKDISLSQHYPTFKISK